MTGEPHADSGERRIRMAQFAAAARGNLTTIGLGSCVAIALYDGTARVGAMAHVLLPDRALARDGASPGKFAETAVPAMLSAIRELGGSPDRVVAKIAGGSSMFAALLSSSGQNMGERNVYAARDALREARVPLVAEDTGGDHGRSVTLRLENGSLEVRSLRRGTRVI